MPRAAVYWSALWAGLGHARVTQRGIGYDGEKND